MTDQNVAVTTAVKTAALRSALMGAVFAVDALGHCLALATLVFAGTLAAGLGLATSLFVFGTLISTIVMVRFSRFPVSLAISQDTSIAILAPAVAVSAGMAAGPAGANIATAFAVVGVSATLSGAGFWLVGRLGLGRLIRMFPFSVSAGFLAGSGYLLVFAAISIVTEANGLSALISAIGEPHVQMRLLPALAMGAALFLAMRFVGGTLSLLFVVFIFLIGYYAVTAAFGITPDRAIALGILPRVPDLAIGGGLNVGFSSLALIDWSAVAVAAPTLAAVVLLNLIGLLLNITGVEIGTRVEVPENKELRIAGLTNIALGAIGGLTAYLQGGASIIAAKLGVARPAFIAGYAAILIPGAVFAPAIVAVTPTFIPAALLIFIGVSMLMDWLVATRRRLTMIDWTIVLAIVLSTAIIGMLWAVAIGFALAVAGFAFASIRVPVIRQATTVAIRRSICDRNALEDAVLAREGHLIRVLQLQGPLFFGSVEQMTRHLRATLAGDPAILHVILDFTEVQSFDSSACAAMDKVSNFASAGGIALHLTNISPGLLQVFDRWGMSLAQGGADARAGSFLLWPTLEHALEHCETDLLARFGAPVGANDTDQVLRHLAHDHPRLSELLALMDRRKLAVGECLIRASDTSRDVYIVQSGRFGIHLPAVSGNAAGLRVRAIGTGSIVGEAAHLTGAPRSADVICEHPAEVLMLSKAAIDKVESQDPDLAALMLAMLGRSLATKLAQANRLLTYVQGGAARSAAAPGGNPPRI